MEVNTKKCNRCQEIKELTQFFTRKGVAESPCKSCRSIQGKIHREKHRDRINAQKKENYKKNKDKILGDIKEKRKLDPLYNEKQKMWRRKNPEHYKKRDREYSKNKRAKDPSFRLLTNMRSRVRLAMKNKNNTTKELLGCNIEFFRKHIESQFTPEMSWDNYGKYWSIDHIKACQTFNLTDPEQQKICFNWTNCRPLPISENSRKGNTIDKRDKFQSTTGVLIR